MLGLYGYRTVSSDTQCRWLNIGATVTTSMENALSASADADICRCVIFSDIVEDRFWYFELSRDQWGIVVDRGFGTRS